jgi:hypothetical protein
MSCRTLERDVHAIISKSLQHQACAPPGAIARGPPQQEFTRMASQSQPQSHSQHGIVAQQQPMQKQFQPDNNNNASSGLFGHSLSQDGATNKLVGGSGGNEEQIEASVSFMVAPHVPSVETELAFKR